MVVTLENLSSNESILDHQRFKKGSRKGAFFKSLVLELVPEFDEGLSRRPPSPLHMGARSLGFGVGDGNPFLARYSVNLHIIEMKKLNGQNVTLRKPTAADVIWRVALGRDPDIERMFGKSKADIKPITQDAAEKWVNNSMNQPYVWIIEVDGKGVGEARLDRVDMNDLRANYAIGIYDPAMLGKGVGTEATLLVLQYAFHDVGLHRVGLRVVAFNERAIRSYQKAGFQIEGRERESCLVDGQRYDDVMMGLLASEFKGAFVEK